MNKVIGIMIVCLAMCFNVHAQDKKAERKPASAKHFIKSLKPSTLNKGEDKHILREQRDYHKRRADACESREKQRKEPCEPKRSSCPKKD